MCQPGSGQTGRHRSFRRWCVEAGRGDGSCMRQPLGSMARAKNAADAASMARVLRGNFSTCSLADFEGELDVVCQRHEAFFTDLFKSTRRPLARLLGKGVEQAWPGHEDGLAIGSRLCEVVQQLRRKGQNATDCSRMPKCVAALVKQLTEPLPQGLGRGVDGVEGGGRSGGGGDGGGGAGGWDRFPAGFGLLSTA